MHPLNEARQLVSKRALATAARFGPTTVPLIIEAERGRPQVVGSAVLLRVRDALFLLTAAHVVDRWGKELLLPKRGGPLEVLGEALTSTPPPEGRDQDKVDAAVIKLAPQIADSLKDQNVLGPDALDVDGRVDEERKHYLLVGFPSTRARFRGWEKRLIAEGFVLTALAADRDAYRAAGLEDAANIILTYDPTDIRDATRKVTPPKLNGISGGAIWNLGSTYNEHGEDARLVGIVTEGRRSTQALIGTRIAVFLAILSHHFPALAGLLPQASGLNIHVTGPTSTPEHAGTKEP